MRLNVKILAILTARPGKAEDLFELLHAIRPRCRETPGNLRWDIWQDEANACRFALDTLYRDAAAVMAYRETAHFKTYAEAIGELAERYALTLEPIEVAPDGD